MVKIDIAPVTGDMAVITVIGRSKVVARLDRRATGAAGVTAAAAPQRFKVIHGETFEAAGAVAPLAAVGHRDMIARLRRRSRAAVMTAETAAGDRSMIHAGTGKCAGAVTVIALGRGLQVAARLNRRATGAAGVTAAAGGTDCGVIHRDRRPCHEGMAGSTIIAGKDMGRWLPRHIISIVTALTGGGKLTVIHGNSFPAKSPVTSVASVAA